MPKTKSQKRAAAPILNFTLDPDISAAKAAAVLAATAKGTTPAEQVAIYKNLLQLLRDTIDSRGGLPKGWALMNTNIHASGVVVYLTYYASLHSHALFVFYEHGHIVKKTGTLSAPLGVSDLLQRDGDAIRALFAA